MDKFKEMFEKQIKHDSIWIDRKEFQADPGYQNFIVQERILIMIDQLIKLLNNFPWKSHKIDKEPNINNVLEQLIDVFKFDIGLFSLLGYSEEDFYNLFSSKSRALEIRWNQEKQPLTENDKVAVFDIDGVIADYDKAFLEFMKQKGYVVSLEKRTSYNYADVFGIDKRTVEKYYDEFIYQSGFSILEPIYGSIELMNHLRSEGIQIVLITARPAWIHSKVNLDTIEWLLKNQVPFDKIYFDKDKADAIINNIYPANVLFIVEDRDKHAVEMSHLGHKIYLINYDYNSQFNEVDYKNIHRVDDCTKIMEIENGI